jgi:hypothetical protein
VLLVPDASKGIAAVRLRADGALKSPFGSGGVARVPVPGGAFDAQQLLRRPDAGCSPSAAGRRRRAIATACPSRASDAVTAGRQVA